ncbi:hypothetical protein ACFVJ4_38415 [Streptomyces sp. NPDC127178]|uniref:hypothetical protein n=1 Tax=unclassified Streptomyces TaxID=2593676 RepID=UPI003634466B
MTELLTAEDGSVAQVLAPVTTVLTEADNPYQVLAWLKRSPSAQLLGRLARQPDDLSHEALDTLGQQAATAYVRGLLVTAGILPKRDETSPSSRTGLHGPLPASLPTTSHSSAHSPNGT